MKHVKKYSRTPSPRYRFHPLLPAFAEPMLGAVSAALMERYEAATEAGETFKKRIISEPHEALITAVSVSACALRMAQAFEGRRLASELHSAINLAIAQHTDLGGESTEEGALVVAFLVATGHQPPLEPFGLNDPFTAAIGAFELTAATRAVLDFIADRDGLSSQAVWDRFESCMIREL